MAFTPPTFNSLIFRQQFPEFADRTLYPDNNLVFAWNMGANWINQNQQPSWGLSGDMIQLQVVNASGGDVTNSGGTGVVSNWTLTPLQQAADLMCAVLVKQLYGPADANGAQTYRDSGGVSGPLTSASDSGTSSSYVLPSFGSSAFSSLLLSSPPYGPMLLALLKVTAGVGPYISSGRFGYIPA